MYKWKIDILLNNGKEITICLECDEANSGEVARNYFQGNKDIFSGFSSLDKSKNVFIKIGDISSFAISVLEE